MRVLGVFWGENSVGRLVQDQSGRLSFAYDISYLNQPDAWAISLSLPLQENKFEGPVVQAFFSGILPDEQLRKRLARFLGVSSKNAFSLLEAVGGECAGALSLYPEGVVPDRVSNDFTVLDEAAVAEMLSLLKQRPLLAGDNIRLSLAGAQDKLAVRLVNHDIALVKGNTPSTHILKPMIEGVEASVYNEYFCMRLADQLGIRVPSVEIREACGEPYYLVSRYDRCVEGAQIMRLHQEDFCQALGVLPECKYEREGGPSVSQSLGLLRDHTQVPIKARQRFLDILIFNYLIGNADAHGKNFALLYTDRVPEFAPAYDLLSTAIYPGLSRKMAMKIGSTYDPMRVLARHWFSLLPDTQQARRIFSQQALALAARVVDVAEGLREACYRDGCGSSIFDQILDVIVLRASVLTKNLKKI